MRRGPLARGLLVGLVCALLLPATAAADPSLSVPHSATQAYQSSSWALGIVVPQGASLQGGGKLRWEGVNNVTAVLTLPNITLPDRIVYVVLSVMTTGGAVLQAAVGVRPNDSAWLAYSWSIPDVESLPLVYRWIVNASGPEMAPSANVTVSIFFSSDSWNLRIADADTGISLERAFPVESGASLRAGDQEVFALESYSRSGTTFRGMGNLTLRSLLLDGARVTGGVYSYGDWDPSRNPLFVVGSSGTSPPAFMSFGQAEDGSFVWGYATVWGSSADPMIAIVETSALLSLVILAVLGTILWKVRRPRRPPNSGGRTVR